MVRHRTQAPACDNAQLVRLVRSWRRWILIRRVGSAHQVRKKRWAEPTLRRWTMTQTRINLTPEQDLRLGLLNTLLTTPHRKLDEIHPVHAEMVRRAIRGSTFDWRPGTSTTATCAITRRCSSSRSSSAISRATAMSGWRCCGGSRRTRSCAGARLHQRPQEHAHRFV